MKAHLQSLVSEKVLSRIDFAGRLEPARLLEIYQRATVCVFPSRWEGFGNVSAEAMACGKPVVVPANSGFAEHIRDGENGMLIQDLDPGAIAGAVKTLLANPALRGKLGGAARDYALKHLEVSTVARKTLGVYREVLTG